MFERLFDRIMAQIFEEWADSISKKLDQLIDIQGVSARSQKQIEIRLANIEGTMSALSEKIKALVAVETEEGKALQSANVELKTALTSAQEKIVVLEAAAASVPELAAQIESLKIDIAAADEASDAISEINPTPVSDGLIEEVVNNPDIETPEVVESAPGPTTETIPEVPVVEAAIDGLSD